MVGVLTDFERPAMRISGSHWIRWEWPFAPAWLVACGRDFDLEVSECTVSGIVTSQYVIARLSTVC